MKRFVCLKTTPRFEAGAIKLQHRRAARAERGRAGVDRFVDRKRFVRRRALGATEALIKFYYDPTPLK